MSSNPLPTESQDLPDWLILGLIVMAGSAGYTLLAYLLYLWAN